MKYILSIFSLFLSLNSFSQQRNPSLEIILSDNEPLQIIVNDRVYNKVNRKLFINDLPAKNNFIEVIKKSNQKDQIVFSGKVKFEKGKHYQAVVLVGEGKLRVSDKRDLINNIEKNDESNRKSAYLNEDLHNNFENNVALNGNMTSDLASLKQHMFDAKTDNDKVSLATQFVLNRSIFTKVDEIRLIANWILFEENKLKFIQNSKIRIVETDKKINSLVDVFSLEENKKNFLQSL